MTTAVHCYCRQSDVAFTGALKCGVCRQFFHESCLRSGRPSPLHGDVFFHFQCALCSSTQQEVAERMKLQWYVVIILSLYNLQLSSSGRLGYFRWKEDICHFIVTHWETFFGSNKKRSSNIGGTVAGALSTWNHQLFESGQEELGESGWWRLVDNSSPTLQLLSATKDKVVKKEKGFFELSESPKVEGLRNRGRKSAIRAAMDLKAQRESGRTNGSQANRMKQSLAGSDFGRLSDEDLCDSKNMRVALAKSKRRNKLATSEAADYASDLADWSQLSNSSFATFDCGDGGSQKSRSSCFSDSNYLTTKDLLAGDSVPEFLLTGEDDDDELDFIDPCAESSDNPLSGAMTPCDDEGDDSSLPLHQLIAQLGSDSILCAEISRDRDLTWSAAPSVASSVADDNDPPPIDDEASNDRSSSLRSSIHTGNFVDALPNNGSTGEEPCEGSSDEESGGDGSDLDERRGSRESRGDRGQRRRRIKRERDQEQEAVLTKPRLQLMSLYEEKLLLNKLKSFNDSIPPATDAYGLRRKLMLRQQQREHGIATFDVDAFMKRLSGQTTTQDCASYRNASQALNFEAESGDLDCRILDRYQPAPQSESVEPWWKGEEEEVRRIPFLHRLMGTPDSELPVIYSPFTTRRLKPFIRRDMETRPLKLRLLDEIVAYKHRNNPTWRPPQRHPIDYCYVRPKHIPCANELARQFFWPGINLSESLQYPDFSCIVLYRKLMIGFAFMVPDNNVKYNEYYVSFVFTHPDWRRAGIATFMLYHLIQSSKPDLNSPTKDVTLHVSMSNPALLLYQKFGFKEEEYILNFYDKYFPSDSKECRNAFFLRLRR